MTEATTDKTKTAQKKGKTAQAVQSIPTESNNAAHAEVSNICICKFKGWEKFQTRQKNIRYTTCWQKN